MIHEKSCGGVIIDGDKVLLIKNKRSLHWSFPKGHMERGESPLQTALREIREETGLNVIIDPTVSSTINYNPTFEINKDVTYFLARPWKGTLHAQESEVSELAWLSINDAIEEITHDNEKEVLKKIYQMYLMKKETK